MIDSKSFFVLRIYRAISYALFVAFVSLKDFVALLGRLCWINVTPSNSLKASPKNLRADRPKNTLSFIRPNVRDKLSPFVLAFWYNLGIPQMLSPTRLFYFFGRVFSSRCSPALWHKTWSVAEIFISSDFM